MAQGTIKKLVSDRGFGFILPETTLPDGKDLFFHRADVEGQNYDRLREGEQVEYELGTDERRGTTKATNVRSLRDR
jgi:cold shock protein